MAWGREKGTDVKISALPVSMRFFDFVPCSLPLKTLILLTFLCFLIRRRGTGIVLYSASALLFLVVKIADQLVKQLNFLLRVSVQHNAR